jgi:Endomembrane protein 70
MWIVAKSILLLNAAILGSILLTNVECRSFKYQTHDKVALAANTVGPFNNPTETYPVRFGAFPFAQSKFDGNEISQLSDSESSFLSQFYSLPFCEGTGKQKRHKQDLGETLSGSHKVTTPYEITFLDNVAWRSLCSVSMDKKDVSESSLNYLES